MDSRLNFKNRYSVPGLNKNKIIGASGVDDHDWNPCDGVTRNCCVLFVWFLTWIFGFSVSLL